MGGDSRVGNPGWSRTRSVARFPSTGCRFPAVSLGGRLAPRSRPGSFRQRPLIGHFGSFGRESHVCSLIDCRDHGRRVAPSLLLIGARSEAFRSRARCPAPCVEGQSPLDRLCSPGGTDTAPGGVRPLPSAVPGRHHLATHERDGVSLTWTSDRDDLGTSERVALGRERSSRAREPFRRRRLLGHGEGSAHPSRGARAPRPRGLRLYREQVGVERVVDARPRASVHTSACPHAHSVPQLEQSQVRGHWHLSDARS